MPRLGSDTPLVGRAEELATLTAAFDGAREARPGLVLVSGDAGVGKTRLLEELTSYAGARGALVLVGRCLEAGESGLPYLPFAEALHGLANHDLVAARPALARMLPQRGAELPAADDELGRLPLFDAVHGLLADLAGSQPVLLVLEDLHWADRSTRDLVSFLAARLRDERLLLVGSYRAEDLHRRHPLRGLLAELVRLPAAERLHVPPFDSADADRFVRTVAARLPGVALPDDALRRVAQRSEGNAFLAEELLATCTECGGEELPPGLADVLLTRLEQLPAPVQHAVRVAAVGGRRVRHDRLQRVAGLADDALDEALRAAVEHHVLVAEPTGEGYVFRHALMQEAVYADLLPGQRTRLHAAHAGVLAAETGPGVAAELAHHSLAGGAQPAALAASVAAAADASRQGAPAEALRHLEQALHLWSAVPAGERPPEVTELDLMVRAGIAASAAGDPERSLAHLRAAAASVDDVADPLQAAHVRRVLGRQLLALDLDAEAYEVTRDALAKLGERPDQPVWPQLMAEHARAAVFKPSQLREAEEIAERAVRAARDLDLPAFVADALITRGLVAHRTGRVPEAVVLLEEAAALAASAGAMNTRLRAVFNLGVLWFEHDRAREGLRTIDEGIRLAEAAGLTWSTFGLELRVMQVLIRAVLGDWDGAERAAEITTGSVSSLVEARVAAAGVWVAVGRGRFAEAERQLARVCRHEESDLQILLLIGLGQAELHLLRDESAAAVAAVDAVLHRLAEDDNSMAFMTIRLCALALAGAARLAALAREHGDDAALAEALSTADRLHEHTRAVLRSDRPGGRAPGSEAQAWSAVADAEHGRAHGRDDPAIWARAADLFSFGAGYEQARCWWRQAAALLSTGGRDAAAGPLRQARDVAERLGATPLAAAVARLTVRAGLDTRPEADGVLTPRERAVLERVALGRTNRQVGAELFISEKTVSVHLSRVMAKLGAASRTEAVALAHARGVLPAPAVQA